MRNFMIVLTWMFAFIAGGVILITPEGPIPIVFTRILGVIGLVVGGYNAYRQFTGQNVSVG